MNPSVRQHGDEAYTFHLKFLRHKVFIELEGFADADMRMFAYTFGNREQEKAWTYYYDSKEKCNLLRRIKKTLDPNGLFSADQFSLRPR